MRRWLVNGFNEWGRPFFCIGMFTMLVGALHMMVANEELGIFSVKAGAIECMVVLFLGWLLRGGAGDSQGGEQRAESRMWLSRDRARRAIQAYFPEDAEEILSDIESQKRAE